MRKAGRATWCLSMVLVAAAVAPQALAQTVAPSSDDDAGDARPAVAPAPAPVMRFDHQYQTGLSVMPGIGYRIIVPYQEMKPCGDSSGDAEKRVCTGALPLFLELQASFGVTARIDLLVDVRFGIMGDPVALDKQRQFAVAPGLRVWLDQDVALKFYTTFQGVLDFTAQAQTDIPKNDYGVRNVNGIMYDLIRNVGFFLQFGETIAFKRWFRVELDVGMGVQARFP